MYGMNNRSYQQFCGLAFALDAVGERWTLLIIRELLAGPRRFKDLSEGLPGVSSNLLAERLKGLEQQGLICRRVLPPPAGTTVYELTPLGQSLEGIVLELGKWGSQFFPPSLEGLYLPSVGSITLAIKAFFHPEQARGVDETYELHFGDDVLHVHIQDGEITVHAGQSMKADAVFATDMQHFVGLFAGQIPPEAALSGGLVRVQGSPDALQRFLTRCGVPSAPGLED